MVMSQEKKRSSIKSIQRQIEMMQRSIQCVFPDATDIRIHMDANGQMELRVSQWEDWELDLDRPVERKKAWKRRYLFDVERRNDKWGEDFSNETNAWYKGRGELLTDEDLGVQKSA